jgi:MoaA/NifB/PqqE/SkfB family radical SAM enzyme
MAELSLEWNVKLNFSTYTLLRTHDKSFMLSKKELEVFKGIIKRLQEFKKKHKNISTSDYAFKKIVDFFQTGYIPNCRTGIRFFNTNPDGTLSPCGLIKTDYASQSELYKNFSKQNTCKYCFTSIRANSEKPLKHLILDSIKSL